jgi:coenzyme F420-0:L-glutamate ligase/coenzyme F420-1:gamma-L-glutamate ligase
MTLTLTPLPKIPLVQTGDNLAEILTTALQVAHITLEDGDILVLAQKIVSKAEGRLVNLATIKPSKEAIELATHSDKDPRLVELILRESHEVLRIRPGTVTPASITPTLPEKATPRKNGSCSCPKTRIAPPLRSAVN